MQGRKVIALGGAALFLLGCVGFATGLHVRRLGVAASHLDRVFGELAGGPCMHPLGEVKLPTRTPVVGESFKLAVGFSNRIFYDAHDGSIVSAEKDNDQDCDISVYIDAPGFEIGDNPRHLKIPPGRSEQFIAIEAKNAGTHEIVINTDLDHKVIGIYVLSNPFFSPSEMFVISGILAFLGPMAALPWWIDYLRNRGQRPNAKKESAT